MFGAVALRGFQRLSPLLTGESRIEQQVKGRVCQIHHMGFLLSSGAKGKRIALPNSEIMIHQPLISGGLSGQCTDIKIASDHLVRVRQKMNEILAENTGKPLEVIERDTERDNYMYAAEAKEYGLIDKVIAHR